MNEASEGLSPQEKLNARFNAWLEAETIQFTSPQAKNSYRERVQRLIDVIQLRKPDRVPVAPRVAFFPAHYSGMTLESAMYDYERAASAWQKFTLDFEPDAASGSSPGSGRVLEYLDYKLFKWPGHGLSPNIPFQYIEKEYMKAEEYDELISDPSSFLLRKYLGRICGKLEPLQKLPSLFSFLEFGTFLGWLVSIGDPGVQEALNSLIKAGQEAARWSQVTKDSDRKLMSYGFPGLSGGFTKAPFDTIGDTLRGTAGIAKDMYRHPDKILKAMEQLTPLMIEMGIPKASAGTSPIVMIPLHKGADGFMSDTQFKKFYWPSLRAVILGLIDRGFVPCLFAEGGYNSRLDIVKDLPSGKTIWYFDQIDLQRAKDTVGKVACMMGNVPLSLLISGSGDDVRNYCKNLIDIAGKNGGLIIATRSGVDIANPENFKEMISISKTYGRY
jgi:hypothetical protein